MKLSLLAKTPDAKTIKSLKDNITTFIMYLNPTMKGVCPNATAGCKAACLFTAGRGMFNSVVEARTRKTKMWLDDEWHFYDVLENDIQAIRRWSRRHNKKVAIRLNGTSDINFTHIIKKYWDLQFYDYTKRFSIWQDARGLKNYHVTFSHSEKNLTTCKSVLAVGGNVAVVFQGINPAKWEGFPVIDGDNSDYRVNDPKGTVIGLKAKGRAKKDERGFVARAVPMYEGRK